MATLALLFFFFSGSVRAQQPSDSPAPAPAPNAEEQPQAQPPDQPAPQPPPPPDQAEPQQQPPDQPAPQPAPPPDSSEEPRTDASPDNGGQPASGAMSLDDARLNFPTIVESFIAENSTDGYWPVRQKTTGKVLKLSFENVLPDSVRQLSEGRFRGRANLRDVDTHTPVNADFTVDFRGLQWKVEGMRLVPTKTRKPRRKVPAAQAQPDSMAQPTQPAQTPADEKAPEPN